MSNFTMPNGTLVELFDYFHPEILDTCEIQCQSNPALMRLEPNIPRGLYWAAYTALSISLAINRIVDSTWPNKQEAPLMYPVNNIAAVVLVLMLNMLMLRAMFRISHTTLTNTQRVVSNNKREEQRNNHRDNDSMPWHQHNGYVLWMAVRGDAMGRDAPIYVTAANLLWQLANGSLAIFYILVNKSMRGEVMKLLGVSSCRRPTIYTTSSDQKAPTLQSNPDMGSA